MAKKMTYIYVKLPILVDFFGFMAS